MLKTSQETKHLSLYGIKFGKRFSDNTEKDL